MPSSTPKQQHFMGMVHALQTGKASAADMPEGIRSKLKTTAKSISKKASGEFAKSVEEYLSFPALTFKQYLVVESELLEAFGELADEEIEELAEKCAMIGEKGLVKYFTDKAELTGKAADSDVFTPGAKDEFKKRSKQFAAKAASVVTVPHAKHNQEKA